MLKAYTVILALIATPAAASTPLKCGQEQGTRKVFCVDPKAISANGNVRSGTLWTGGPNDIQKTDLKIILDCKTGVSVLRDTSGVNLGGGKYGDQPQHMDQLYDLICAAKPYKNDKNIKLF